MARTRRTGIGNSGGRSAQCQSVQIIVNPKTCRMDKTMRDILSISELVTGRIRGIRLKSIAVNDYFAVVKADIPKGLGLEEITLRFYELKGAWKMRGCAFSDEEKPSTKLQHEPQIIFEKITN
ncbi:MAG: hypothetical protein AUK32_00515 [Candidatus Aquicultor secundus]|uniref:hypothetical protein n=1 Tax=Candidatus Aquicultor secundus TaxID=1973895 RepID=UPI00091660B1|nr:hypothetical protein [Candidatus Aquicultor secundus]OIO88781.1 MAG: hypothetical protein AUK32_00515 [Candidatus Aquicultor secundus]PIU26092.1 MAG: hypothetical protein COT10_10460 [Candidatus Aquicultor secundus]